MQKNEFLCALFLAAFYCFKSVCGIRAAVLHDALSSVSLQLRDRGRIGFLKAAHIQQSLSFLRKCIPSVRETRLVVQRQGSMRHNHRVVAPYQYPASVPQAVCTHSDPLSVAAGVASSPAYAVSGYSCSGIAGDPSWCGSLSQPRRSRFPGGKKQNISCGTVQCAPSKEERSKNGRKAFHCICTKPAGDGVVLHSRGPLVLRFAPSPTGELHVGGARTALLNYALLMEHRRHQEALSLSGASGESECLSAVRNPATPHGQHAGVGKATAAKLILRIEDTDEARNNRASEASLIRDLRWLGIQWDEGPDIGGPRGPYRQSERLGIYWHHGRDLLKRNVLYRCFCSKKRLRRLRQECTRDGVPPRYDGKCRSLNPQEAERLSADGLPFTLRFRTPAEPDTISFNDALRGPLTFSLERTLGDFVCFRQAGRVQKSGDQGGKEAAVVANMLQEGREGEDRTSLEAPLRVLLGTPVYNFCAAVDDWLMGVTAVVRGEEHIQNTIAQILIARALTAPIPLFCHLPVMLAKEGGKISKRRQGSQAVPVSSAVLPSENKRSFHFPAVESECARSGASTTPSSIGSNSTDYTIRRLRLRGFHPEAVADCLIGHHLGATQTPGDADCCVGSLGKSAFCFDAQHLRHAHRQKIKQLVRSPRLEPLVLFFCDIISMAPGIFDVEADSPPAASKHELTASGPIHQYGGEVARLREEDPWLFKFVALAARLLLPQCTEPSAVVNELIAALQSRTKALKTEENISLFCRGPEEVQHFRAVAAALIKSKDFLASLSIESCADLSCEVLGISVGERYQKRQHRKTGDSPSFDVWAEQLSKYLGIERSKVLRLARIALTGRDVGMPLAKLVSVADAFGRERSWNGS